MAEERRGWGWGFPSDELTKSISTKGPLMFGGTLACTEHTLYSSMENISLFILNDVKTIYFLSTYTFR